jgi:hypothetical protein
MTLPDERIDVERIEDFEGWIERLGGAEWDFIATYPYGSGKCLEFRRARGGGREFIQFIFRSTAPVGRVRLYFGEYVVVEDGVVGFEKMRVRVEIHKMRDGLVDISVNVVEAKARWILGG